jgi:Mg-chelatase subunit ChlD
MLLKELLALACMTAAGALCVSDSNYESSAAAQELVFVTDDDASITASGCDAITVVEASIGRALHWGGQAVSVGRLAASPDGLLAVSVSNNSEYGSRGQVSPFLYVLSRRSLDDRSWRTDWRLMSGLTMGGPVAISPSGKVLLLPIRGGVQKYFVQALVGAYPGAPVGRYGSAPTGGMAFSADSQTAYIADVNGLIHIVDVESMTRTEDLIAAQPVAGSHERRVRNTNTSLSPDGRYLVTNIGGQGNLNVIDLRLGIAATVKATGLSETWGVDFNHVTRDHNLLAVHGRSTVAVYALQSQDSLSLLASAPVAPQQLDAWGGPDPRGPNYARVAALSWTGKGDGLVVATGSTREWRVFDYHPGTPARLARRTDFDSCDHPRGFGMALDVIAVERAFPTPTGMASPLPSATATASPTSSPTSTPSLATPTNTVTTTPTPTRSLKPAFLPLILREDCDPGRLHADVVLVIDASSSMLDPTRDGRSKLAAAIEAVELFLAQMNLPLDQAAIVQFNGDVELLQELTGDRSALLASLDRLQVRRQTRIDLGIQVAHEELKSNRRRPGNQAVMIVLTDGKANPVGPDAAVREAAKAKADEITVFTIGLGDDLDLAALESMASSPGHFYRAPDAEDLAEIYSKIAMEIPCPAEDYWGRR